MHEVKLTAGEMSAKKVGGGKRGWGGRRFLGAAELRINRGAL
jgi:hypothetical protein